MKGLEETYKRRDRGGREIIFLFDGCTSHSLRV